ncbi:hypothetical protein PDE_06098 [Penicillium oxalicum 114-2]|uniref:Uncharacterized protein n=1 Tax=Penicillium oxalicum (strain 114-2 / CGMCC 5302) TaxID=933388 RepID=S8AXQ9_PENO1|nr:hypothetical protein PDE_06098 [Penicillium oxalicum 114-2]
MLFSKCRKNERTSFYELAEIYIALMMHDDNLRWAKGYLVQALRDRLVEQVVCNILLPGEARDLAILASYLHQKILIQRTDSLLTTFITSANTEEAYTEALVPIGARIQGPNSFQHWEMTIALPTHFGELVTVVGSITDHPQMHVQYPMRSHQFPRGGVEYSVGLAITREPARRTREFEPVFPAREFEPEEIRAISVFESKCHREHGISCLGSSVGEGHDSSTTESNRGHIHHTPIVLGHRREFRVHRQ